MTSLLNNYLQKCLLLSFIVICVGIRVSFWWYNCGYFLNLCMHICIYVCVWERGFILPNGTLFIWSKGFLGRDIVVTGEMEVDEVTYNYGIEIELHIANQYNSHFTTPKNEPQSLLGSDVYVCARVCVCVNNTAVIPLLTQFVMLLVWVVIICVCICIKVY